MKILVVDDSKAMRMIVLRNLRQSFEGATFTEATDGVDALAKIDADKPDLILSDWNMPEMTGIDLCRQRNWKEMSVTFGFVTSESTAEMRALAEDAGASFLIAKPFDADTLKNTVQDALAKAES